MLALLKPWDSDHIHIKKGGQARGRAKRVCP